LLERRVVPDVLAVTAGQLGYPVAFRVEVEPGDGLPHRFTALQPCLIMPARYAMILYKQRLTPAGEEHGPCLRPARQGRRQRVSESTSVP